MKRRLVAAIVLALGCQRIAGCTETPIEPYTGTEPKAETLYVVKGGWHTEIALPVRALTGSLRELTEARGRASFVVFGWGQRVYYMATNPDFGDLLKAAMPGPAVMLVIPLEKPPADVFGRSNVFAVPVSSAGLAHLAEYLWADLKKGASGVPRAIAPGPYPDSTFYASSGTYEVGHNCNTWTVEALRVAGLLVDTDGVLFADQVVEQIRKLERLPSSSTGSD